MEYKIAVGILWVLGILFGLGILGLIIVGLITSTVPTLITLGIILGGVAFGWAMAVVTDPGDGWGPR